MKQIFYGRRTACLAVLLALALAVSAQKAKYVFYFIGDGMGVNQVNGTEMMLGEQQGRIGIDKLQFPSFPCAALVTTYSATNGITDSSAAGTALATGSKTYNGAIGLGADKQPLKSIATRAKAAGYKVGVTTSVSVDHATPAAFYGHQPDRDMYYEIASEIPASGFDFFAGGGFLKPETKCDGSKAPNVLGLIEQGGYTIARGADDYKAKCAAAKKMVLIQKEGKPAKSIPYAIDRKADDLTLTQITESAIDFLTKDKRSKGFFLMVEGGKIDWACHGHDGATAFREVQDMDEAIRAAYRFYQRHPKETLIVVTADHETGGISLGAGKYYLNFKLLANQKQSVDELSRAMTDLRARTGNKVKWEDMRSLLSEKMGFWRAVELTWPEERQLRDVFEATFVGDKRQFDENMYAKNEQLASTARDIMDTKARIGWTTKDHSDGYVPLFAVGAGAEKFHGRIDNTTITPTIAAIMGIRN